MSNGRKKSIVEAETLYTSNTYLTKAPSARAISTSSVQEQPSKNKEMKAFTTNHSAKPSIGGFELPKKPSL